MLFFVLSALETYGISGTRINHLAPMLRCEPALHFLELKLESLVASGRKKL